MKSSHNLPSNNPSDGAETVPQDGSGGTYGNEDDGWVRAVDTDPRRETYSIYPGQTPFTALNLGCGYQIMESAVNIDRSFPDDPRFVGRNHKVHIFDTVKRDFDNPLWSYGLPQSHFTEIHASHLIEHLRDTYDFMDNVYQLAAPNAKFILRTPYGTSDDAWEDQTHVRPFFVNSWQAFSQLYHWRSDVGYRADWHCERVHLLIRESTYRHYCPFGSKKEDQTWVLDRALHKYRNVVAEMIVELVAIKPARPVTPNVKPSVDDWPRPEINFVRVPDENIH